MKREFLFPQPDWEGMHALQESLPEESSLWGPVQEWLELQNLFHKHLEETEKVFRPQRGDYLQELQNRLRKIGSLFKKHAKSS